MSSWVYAYVFMAWGTERWGESCRCFIEIPQSKVSRCFLSCFPGVLCAGYCRTHYKGAVPSTAVVGFIFLLGRLGRNFDTNV